MKNENKSHRKKLSRVVTIINPSASSINPTTYTSSTILAPIFPARESCSTDSANSIFGRLFLLPCKISDKKCFIQIFTNDEMLSVYYIPISNDSSVIYYQSDILNDLLPFSIPWTFWFNIMEDNNRSNNMLDYFMLGYTTQCNTYQ